MRLAAEWNRTSATSAEEAWSKAAAAAALVVMRQNKHVLCEHVDTTALILRKAGSSGNRAISMGNSECERKARTPGALVGR